MAYHSSVGCDRRGDQPTGYATPSACFHTPEITITPVSSEPGNIRYDVLRLRETPATYRVYEVYESADAFEAHKTSNHLKKIFPELRKLFTAPAVIVQYDILKLIPARS